MAIAKEQLRQIITKNYNGLFAWRTCMSVYRILDGDLRNLEPIFENWNKTLIWSCLQGEIFLLRDLFLKSSPHEEVSYKAKKHPANTGCF